MSNSVITSQYSSNWGEIKLGKLWLGASDLLGNGKQPLLPANSFYESWLENADSLRLMANRILRYLKLQLPIRLDVDFSNQIETPGVFKVENSEGKILINPRHKNNSTACAAILAHEICHLVLTVRGIREENDYENERLTDFATAYFGLGILALNGKYISRKIDIVPILGILSFIFAGAGFLSNPVRKVENSFGYWSAEEYRKIFDEYITRNNLPVDKITPYLKEGR